VEPNSLLKPALAQRGRVAGFIKSHRIGVPTLLFTDMVGSTQLKQELGDLEAVRLIQQHHAELRKLLTEFSEAEEIETAGDSFFVVFAKPSDAAKFAILWQARLRTVSAESGRIIQDRIGIHVGEVLIQQESDTSMDLYGLQVDTTARVMSLAEVDRFFYPDSRSTMRANFSRARVAMYHNLAVVKPRIVLRQRGRRTD